MEAIDEGGPRTGTVWTATAHVVTAVIGSGVLALPWSVAQMGWILGTFFLIAFPLVTYFTAVLLSDCYRSPNPINGKRNPTYMDAVKAFLGPKNVVTCGILQYANLWGTMVGYTTAASDSMMAVKRSMCLHKRGQHASCGGSNNLHMIIFGIMQIVLSQLPSMEKITWLSVIAAIMSFTYSFICLFLCIATLASHKQFRGSLTGAMTELMDISGTVRVWNVFQALGNIAFAYSYSMVQLEIQDTVKSPPPENKTMKRAAMYGISTTTAFYVLIGSLGFGAFGNRAPGNMLVQFNDPFWLVQIANLCLIVHLLGAYQVYAQPIFACYEKWLVYKWPRVRFFSKFYKLRILFSKSIHFTLNQLILRTILVVLSTLVAIVFPYFNSILGLIGAIAFWPLTVYYPISMYMVQANIKTASTKWWFLQILSIVCFIVSFVAAVGSIASSV